MPALQSQRDVEDELVSGWRAAAEWASLSRRAMNHLVYRNPPACDC